MAKKGSKRIQFSHGSVFLTAEEKLYIDRWLTGKGMLYKQVVPSEVNVQIAKMHSSSKGAQEVIDERVQFSDGSVFLTTNEMRIVYAKIARLGLSEGDITKQDVKTILTAWKTDDWEKIDEELSKRTPTPKEPVEGVAATRVEYLQGLKDARGKWEVTLEKHPDSFEARQAIEKLDKEILTIEMPKVPRKPITGNITRAIRETITTNPSLSLKQIADSLHTSKNYVRNVRKSMVKNGLVKPTWRNKK